MAVVIDYYGATEGAGSLLRKPSQLRSANEDLGAEQEQRRWKVDGGSAHLGHKYCGAWCTAWDMRERRNGESGKTLTW